MCHTLQPTQNLPDFPGLQSHWPVTLLHTKGLFDPSTSQEQAINNYGYIYIM